MNEGYGYIVVLAITFLGIISIGIIICWIQEWMSKQDKNE
jgi:hypothetical protein